MVLFGGFAPPISTLLVQTTGDPAAPAFYVMAGALSAVAILSMKEYANVPLE